MRVRRIALSLLDEYESAGKYVNLSLASHKTDGLSVQERGFLTALLYTAVERKLTYDHLVGAIGKRAVSSVAPSTLNILRLGLCQLLHMRSVADHAAVKLTVDLCTGKGERGFVNAILREAVRLRDENRLPLPPREKNLARALSVEYSFPLSTVKRFIALFGNDGAEALMRRYNESAYTDLSVNLLKTDRESLCARLSESGYTAHPSAYSGIGVRVEGSVDPTRLYGFEEGLFFVQDEASAVCAEALGAGKGDRVLDLCACPGGKSFAVSILSGAGFVECRDIHDSKLSLITSGADRLGLLGITTLAHDASESLPEDEGKFDRIICDVPCSGLGVMGKKPDLRYRSLEECAELPALQLSILKAAARALKPGGVLVYSTCTLLPEENSEVVSRFLEECSGFSRLDFTVGGLSSEGGELTLLPHIHGTDGFFMAKIVKDI